MLTKYFKTISFDPGNNLGVTIMTIEYDTFKIIDIITETVILNDIIPIDPVDVMRSRTVHLQKYLAKLFEKHQPLVVSFELSFANIRFPKAVIQLTQYITIIEAMTVAYNPFTKIFKYAPKFIKKGIGASGNADKDAMTVAVGKLNGIESYVDVKRVSEHEVDSLAIAYLTYDIIKNHRWQMLMIV